MVIAYKQYYNGPPCPPHTHTESTGRVSTKVNISRYMWFSFFYLNCFLNFVCDNKNRKQLFIVLHFYSSFSCIFFDLFPPSAQCEALVWNQRLGNQFDPEQERET